MTSYYVLKNLLTDVSQTPSRLVTWCPYSLSPSSRSILVSPRWLAMVAAEAVADGEEDVAAVAEDVEVSITPSQPDNRQVSDLDGRRLLWRQFCTSSQQSLVNTSAYPFQVTTVEQKQREHNQKFARGHDT